jgi:hypothetical protein
MADFETHIGELSAGLRETVQKRWNEVTGVLFIYLVPAPSQFSGSVAPSTWVFWVVVANLLVALETKRDRIIQHSGAILINVRNFDPSAASFSAEATVSRTPQQRFNHIFRLEILES